MTTAIDDAAWWPPEETPLEVRPTVAPQPLPGLDLSRLGHPPSEPDWIVRDRLARGWLTLLGAKPGTGKTWLSTDLAVALAIGRPWLGHEVTAASRVLVIDAENGDDLALERLRQLGATADDLGGRLQYVTEPVTLPNADDLARLRVTLEQHRPDVVIFDTLASIAPTAERDTESAAAFYSAVWSLVRTHRASMLLLVHLRKSMQGAGKDDQLDAFRGAGHLVGAAHRAWTLESIAGDKPVFLLHDVKARRGHKLPTVRVEVIDAPDSEPLRTSVEVAGTVDEVENGHDAYIADVLVFIDNHATRMARTADLIHLPSAPVERTAKSHLTRARAIGVLAQPQRGYWARAGAQLPTDPETEELA